VTPREKAIEAFTRRFTPQDGFYVERTLSVGPVAIRLLICHHLRRRALALYWRGKPLAQFSL
jgi:hypothetical protein